MLQDTQAHGRTDGCLPDHPSHSPPLDATHEQSMGVAGGAGGGSASRVELLQVRLTKANNLSKTSTQLTVLQCTQKWAALGPAGPS
jgi:hypothetical protein